MELGPDWYQIGYKTCYIPKVGRVSVEKGYMLTDLKVSSLAWKCVFHRPKHNAAKGPHRIEFERSWNAEMKFTNS